MDEKPTRKKNRLENFNYSEKGDYFVTICVKDRRNFFWKSNYKDILTKDSHMLYNKNGDIADKIIQNINITHKDNVNIEKFTIMPDHIHLLVYICQNNKISLENVVRLIKRQITTETGIKDLWQKNFYDHIIRNQKDYDEVWEYIDANPRKKTGNIFMK